MANFKMEVGDPAHVHADVVARYRASAGDPDRAEPTGSVGVVDPQRRPVRDPAPRVGPRHRAPARRNPR